MKEEDALRLLLEHFGKTGRGSWEGNRGTNPPDFIVVNPQTSELAAVEHTKFFWPPEQLTFDWALESIKSDVNERIRSRVEGIFGVGIEHEDRDAFSGSFEQLSRARRPRVSEWLAREIETAGMRMSAGDESPVDGPLPCRLIRYSESGPGQMIWAQWMSIGGPNLGIRPMVRVQDGTVHVKRLNGPNSVLGELERVLARKGERLKAVDYGRRVLVVEYYASLRESLEYIAAVLNVPQTIDELYFLVFPGPEVVRCSGGGLGAGA